MINKSARPPMVIRAWKVPQALANWLKTESEKLGISGAELVRRIIDEYRARHP